MSEGFDLLNALGYVSLGIAFLSFGNILWLFYSEDVKKLRQKMGDNSSFIEMFKGQFNEEMNLMKREMLTMQRDMHSVCKKLSDVYKDKDGSTYTVKTKNGSVFNHKGNITIDNKNGKIYVDGVEVRPTNDTDRKQELKDKKIKDILSDD